MRILIMTAVAVCYLGTLVAQPQTSTNAAFQRPIDDVVASTTMQEKRVLPYAPVREADILWKKRIWREIDTREKMNLTFRNPEMPLVKILTDAVLSGELRAYDAEDDKFSVLMDKENLDERLYKVDSVYITDPITYEDTLQIVRNDFDPQDVKRFRLKEVWYFDANTSTMKVRIIGIAPLVDVYGDNNDYRYSTPLFWIYYPDARKLLAKQAVYIPGNDKKVMSWEDILEMRFFTSYITKESNVMDERLQERYSGEELLRESEKIRQKIFNIEQDMWSN